MGRPGLMPLVVAGLMALAGCSSPGDGGKADAAAPALATGCPPEAAALSVDLCLAEPLFSLDVGDCTSPLFSYQAARGTAGVPQEWGEAGLTPATTSIHLQSLACTSAVLNGQDLGPLALGLWAAATANSPEFVETNATVGTGDYLLGLLVDHPLLSQYLAWRGVPVVAGQAAIDGAGPTTRWQTEEWSLEGRCVEPSQASRLVTAGHYWHGPLADPLTLVLLAGGTFGRVSAGSLQADGGPAMEHWSGASVHPGICTLHAWAGTVTFR